MVVHDEVNDVNSVHLIRLFVMAINIIITALIKREDKRSALHIAIKVN